MNYKKTEVAPLKENINENALRLKGGGIISPFMPMGSQMMPCFPNIPYQCYPAPIPNMCGSAPTIILNLPNLPGASQPCTTASSPKADTRKSKRPQSFMLTSFKGTAKRTSTGSASVQAQMKPATAGIQNVSQPAKTQPPSPKFQSLCASAQSSSPSAGQPVAPFGQQPVQTHAPSPKFQSLIASAQSGSPSAVQGASRLVAQPATQAELPGPLHMPQQASALLHSSFLADKKNWSSDAPEEGMVNEQVLNLLKLKNDHKIMARQDLLAAKVLKKEIEDKMESNPQEIESLINIYEDLKQSGVKHYIKSNSVAKNIAALNEGRPLQAAEAEKHESLYINEHIDSELNILAHYALEGVDFNKHAENDRQLVYELYKEMEYGLRVIRDAIFHAKVLMDRLNSRQITDKEELDITLDVYESMRRTVMRHFKRVKTIILYIEHLKEK